MINIIKKLSLKKWLIIGVIILVTLTILSSTSSTKQPINLEPIISPTTTPNNQNNTAQIPNTTSSTVSASPIVIDYNPVEATKAWNDAFNKSLSDYEKTDRHRIDTALAQVRQQSPIVQDGFTIDYSYKTSTYTISVSEPFAENKQKSIYWLAGFGITEKDFSLIRIKWVTAAP
jgi:hypothetical protein